MNWTQSKIDTLLKIAVCLAMIGGMAGCSGGNSRSLDGTASPALSITSSDWTYPDGRFSMPVCHGSATIGSGSHGDRRPTAQV